MIRRSGSDHYAPLSWDAAFAHVAHVLRGLDSPDQAIFYTSGRTSNEAAFLYQLLVRRFGTNNLPDCSNMCHESSGTALSQTIGVGKGTVSLADFALADAIFVIGQNPGTNHPRMLATLEQASRRGCRIVSVNPLRERGLVRFAHPKRLGGLLGRGTGIASLFLPVRVGGDVALLKGIMKEVLALDAETPGGVIDRGFLAAHTEGFEAFRAGLDAPAIDDLERESGVPRQAMREAARIYVEAERVIACWAMGLTQHRHGVDNVRELTNLMLLRGNLGRPGAGVCPVRGHSNVQGDRTMGITEAPGPAFLASLSREFGFEPPARPGHNTVEAIRAMHEGRARVFFALGGNFARATPDPAYTEAALARCRLTVQVSTTLNRSHLVTGEEAILLPCLARSERDLQASGPQLVSVEDSMSTVRRSQGRLAPASPQVRSEPAIVAGLARALLGPADAIPWEDLVADYDRIRERIARVVPGFADMNRRVREPGGFVLPSGARTRSFETPTGRVPFALVPLPRFDLGPGELLLMTIRSHDQFNTTVYGPDDRYRGIRGSRRVVLISPEDAAERGLAAGDRVALVSRFGAERRSLPGLRVVCYEIPRGCVAAYYPEANVLVPVGSFAAESMTPSYKSVPVTVTREEEPIR
jgi:molybdopterin-dependent oxidoreductase alpha subunit